MKWNRPMKWIRPRVKYAWFSKIQSRVMFKCLSLIKGGLVNDHTMTTGTTMRMIMMRTLMQDFVTLDQ